MRRLLGIGGTAAVLATLAFGDAPLDAIAPGIEEVSQTFPQHVVTNSHPIMSATTVGGVMLAERTEGDCGKFVLRL